MNIRIRRALRLDPLLRWVRLFGINPLSLINTLRWLPGYFQDYRRLKAQLGQRWEIHLSYPCLGEHVAAAGFASGHYFHQDFYVARAIFERKPAKHVDVGSRIDGFVAHVASFRPIELIDIRPLPVRLHNITYRQADFTRMETVPQDYCDSLSCLHAIEHFGLGRYGDAIDSEGWRKGLECLAAMLSPHGTLYLSTPIGRPRIEFNGHRVFAIDQILTIGATLNLELLRFSYVDDSGTLHENHFLTPTDRLKNLSLEFGCGIFEFRKTVCGLR